MFEPILDHAVIDVRDGIDEAQALFGRLGFALQRRGHHTLGTSNHLAVFESNYLEILGWERGATLQRPELTRYPAGLGGLVFRADDADTIAATLANVGLPAQPPRSFSRPVTLPNGASMEARFRTVSFEHGTFGWTRTYFCEHFTPELVWRDEWQVHPNAAADIVRVVIQAAKPHRLGTLFATMFGEAQTTLAGETCILRTKISTIEVMQPAEIGRIFGKAAPDLHGRDEAMVALTFRSSDLVKTAATLDAANVETIKEDDRIVVPAAEAANVTLEFVAPARGVDP